MTSPQCRSDYRTEEHLGCDALQSVRALWERWQRHPNADIDFFSTIAESRLSVESAIALVVYHNDTPVAMAAGRIEKAPLPISFGYLKVSRSALRQLTIVYGGLMGEWDEPAAVVFIQYLRQLMRRDHIDTVYLAPLPLDHPVRKAAQWCVPYLLRDTVLKGNLHWWSDLPDTYDTFLKKISSKHRTQLRSKERKLSECCGGALQVRVFQAPEEVPLFCTTAEKIAQATYLRGLGEGFHDSDEMRRRLALAARKEWMRGYVLYANEKSSAFWLGTLYHQVFFLDYTGFDSGLKDFAPGQILFIKMIENLCNAGGIRGIDFGFGDAEYKQRYGDRNWEESDLYLFNKTPAMLVWNLARKSAKLLRVTAEKTLKRFALFTRIKRRWRLSAERSATHHRKVDVGP